VSGELASAFSLPGWLGDQAKNFWSLDPAVKISVFQLIVLITAGYWAYHLYRIRRQSEATVRIQAMVRISRKGWLGAETLVFIRVHVLNSSAVLVRAAEATLTLLDASRRGEDGLPTYTRLWQADPLRPTTSELGEKRNEITFEPKLSDLEPGECLESEVVYVPSKPLPSLIGLRMTVVGTQGRWLGQDYEWSNFGFVDTSYWGSDYRAISFHASKDSST
jgi:hypothetical protein